MFLARSPPATARGMAAAAASSRGGTTGGFVSSLPGGGQRRSPHRLGRPQPVRLRHGRRALPPRPARTGATCTPRPSPNEHPSATETVTDRGRRHQESGETERVGVDRPLRLPQWRAEVCPDPGQRRRDEERIERDHEQRRRGDDDRSPRPACYPIGSSSRVCAVTCVTQGRTALIDRGPDQGRKARH
jgi:hypothetical protein